jgi:hypothetical protein
MRCTSKPIARSAGDITLTQVRGLMPGKASSALKTAVVPERYWSLWSALIAFETTSESATVLGSAVRANPVLEAVPFRYQRITCMAVVARSCFVIVILAVAPIAGPAHVLPSFCGLRLIWDDKSSAVPECSHATLRMLDIVRRRMGEEATDAVRHTRRSSRADSNFGH